MSSHDTLNTQENHLSAEPNQAAENHDSSSSESPGDTLPTDRRYQRGLEAFASEFQMPSEEVASLLAEHVGKRFSEEAILSMANIWTNEDELSLRDRSLIVIASLLTQSGTDKQHLRVHTRWAIQHGCTRKQLEALAMVLSIYIGQPYAVDGLIVMREEVARLEAQ